MASKENGLIRRYPVLAYFTLTFGISWMGALGVAAPHLIRHHPLTQLTGVLMFPAMLLGPCCCGLVLARVVDRPAGLRDLYARLHPGGFPLRWYTPVVLLPILILTVLFFLEAFVSPVYAPNRFLLGVLFGIPAGVLEEIGWTGYAFPKMRRQHSGWASSVLLGLVWGAWHWPVIDYLGTATPHGSYRLRFFLAFTFVMVAVRALISWVYDNTRSIWLAQLIHISSTGSLVVFSPSRLTAAQEVAWYLLYGIVLWLVVSAIVGIAGKTFRRSLRQQPT